MQIWPLYNGWRQYLLPSPTSLQAKQTQFYHPLLLYHKLPSKHFLVLPLNLLQFANVSLVLGSQKLDTAFQMCLTNAKILHEVASAWRLWVYMQSTQHLTLLLCSPCLWIVPHPKWHFFPPVSVQVLPSLPHPCHIAIPFVARATSSHCFVGSLALLICYFFPFWYFLLHFSSKTLSKTRQAKKILISFQVLSFPHSPSLQLFQVNFPFLEHGTLYFQWTFMSTWYQGSNTSQPLWELPGMHLISCWIFPMPYKMVA